MDTPESREMTEQIDWRAKQPSQVVCVSEDNKMSRSLRHYRWMPCKHQRGRCHLKVTHLNHVKLESQLETLFVLYRRTCEPTRPNKIKNQQRTAKWFVITEGADRVRESWPKLPPAPLTTHCPFMTQTIFRTRPWYRKWKRLSVSSFGFESPAVLHIQAHKAYWHVKYLTTTFASQPKQRSCFRSSMPNKTRRLLFLALYDAGSILSGFLHVNSPVVFSVLFQIHVYQCLRSLNLFIRSPKRQHLEVQKLPFTTSACTEKPPLHLLSRTQLLHEGTYICNLLRLKNEDYIRMSKGRK